MTTHKHWTDRDTDKSPAPPPAAEQRKQTELERLFEEFHVQQAQQHQHFMLQLSMIAEALRRAEEKLDRQQRPVSLLGRFIEPAPVDAPNRHSFITSDHLKRQLADKAAVTAQQRAVSGVINDAWLARAHAGMQATVGAQIK
jgi:hypothetical protein